MQIDITFTEAASAYLKKMIEKENGIGFRLSIKKTGCSGYSYVPSVVTAENKQDALMQLANGVKVFVDMTWKGLLNGLRVDYIEEEKAGLKQKRLSYTNPHEAGRCGCGESFVADQDGDKNA